MKTIYQSPIMQVYAIIGQTPLLDGSIKIDGTQKVNSTTDIGFVKEQRPQNYDVWADDWSK